MVRKEKEVEEVKEKVFKLQAGTCEIILTRDERGRPVLQPVCPRDEKTGDPVVSEEVKVLSEVFHAPEVILRTPKVIGEGEKVE